MTHECGLTQRQAELPNRLNEMQTSAMFKGDDKTAIYLQKELIPFP